MTIERSSVSKPFTVNWNGDEIRSNLSLIYKLQEQGVKIPNFEEFEFEQDLIKYFKEIESIISNKPGWKISKDIFLSSFNFKKFVMFKDLDLSNWSGIENNPIKSLFYIDEDNGDYDEDLNLNSMNSSEIYNVVDADSSQLAVLEEAKKGKNLVVEGPPGTGKSQTIVNLIAELMAKGDKVLFVSEKKAALDVVKTRLDTVGLGEGCLELHGKNSNKKEFLNELEKTLNIDSIELSDENYFQDLDNIKYQLDEYIDTLHTYYKETELTPFQLIGIYEYRRQKLSTNNQENLKLDIYDVSKLNKDKRGEIIRKLNDIVKYYDLISPVSSNIWRHTYPENLSSPDIKNLNIDLKDFLQNITKFDELDEQIHKLTGISKINSLNIESLISKLKILQPNLKLLKEENALKKLIEDINIFQEKLGNTNIDVLNLDLNDMKIQINSLNINMDIIDEEDFKTIIADFKTNKNIIKESNLENALKNPNLEEEFKEFKTKRTSFFKRLIDSDFKRIKHNFKSYYSYDITDDQIESDFEKIIVVNNDLTKLRNKILVYFKSDDKNDDKIIIESEKLLSWVSELDKIKSNLSSYKVSVQKNAMKTKIKTLIELKTLLQSIEDRNEVGEYYFNDDWKSHNSNIKILKQKLTNIIEFKKNYDSGYFNNETITFIESNNFDTLNNYLDELSDVKNQIMGKYQELDDRLHFKDELLITADTSTYKIKRNAESLMEKIENLNDYRLFTKYCNEYSDKYAKQLIDYIKEDKIKSNMVTSLFYYNFADIALRDVFSLEPILDEFNSQLHEERQSKFKELDKNIIEFNKYRVREVLGKNRPNMSIGASPNSSLGILKREMGKKRKIKPIRQILTETSDIIAFIKPCFMMSPLSIAQYLDPKVYESYFDYVIFDEASQVKIEDGIGAMLRGNKYIVMGDTKQLPPTDFFEKELDIDEEDEEIFTDNIESIVPDIENYKNLSTQFSQ